MKELKLDIKENIGLTNVGVRHPWETARAEIVWSLFKKSVVDSNDQTINVLDIGAGDLFQAKKLAGRDYRLQITALDSAYTEEVRNRLLPTVQNLNVELVQTFDELRKGEVYSYVLLMDVLEHIEDDKGFLKELVSRDIFDDRTLFFISVPAWQYLFSGHDRYLGHYRRYSNKSFDELLKSCDVKIIRSGGLFFGLWFIRSLQFGLRRLLFRKESEKSDLGVWTAGRWIAGLIKYCLLADSYLLSLLLRLGLRLPGLSLFAVCKKQATVNPL